MTYTRSMTDIHSHRLLLTARDVGAGGHIATLAEGLLQRGIAFDLVGQGAAARYFTLRGLAFLDAGDWFQGTFEEYAAGHLDDAHLALAETRLRDGKIAAVICGLSSVHSDGIDELAVLAAKRCNIPSFAMQDFWGDVKIINGMTADHYLVIDERAAELTRKRCSAAVKVVGSPKHSRFQDLDLLAMRQTLRQQLGIGMDDVVLGYFGQNLTRMQGYREIVHDVAAAAQQSGARLIYRPHPLEGAESHSITLGHFNDAGVSPHLLNGGPIEQALVISDIVLSCFSTAGYDAVQMARISELDSPVAIYADYPADIADFWRFHAKCESLPHVEAGMALSVRDKDGLLTAIEAMSHRTERQRLISHIKTHLAAPADAVGTIVQYIQHNLGLCAAPSRD